MSLDERAEAGAHAPCESGFKALHPASTVTAHQGQGRPGWPRGQYGSPFSYPGPVDLLEGRSSKDLEGRSSKETKWKLEQVSAAQVY